tara:strand:+ start:976 stop:1275 length:300 start_codon:yes stop_codon:yes gene_type:complete
MPMYSYERLKRVFGCQNSADPEIQDKWKLCRFYYHFAWIVCVLGIVVAGLLRRGNDWLAFGVGVGLIAIAIFLEFVSQRYQQQLSNLVLQRGKQTNANQ